jgi:hypothetical protein
VDKEDVKYEHQTHEIMEKSKVGTQIYAYTICVVAVITFLISVTALVNAVMDLQDPLHAGWVAPGSASLASFENYKMDILKSTQKGDEASKEVYVPDDKTLRAMYEAARADKIQTVRHQSNKSIMVSGLLIVICVLLFGIHWRWARKISRAEV